MEEIKVYSKNSNIDKYEEYKKTIEKNPTKLLKALSYPEEFRQQFIAYNDNYIRYYDGKYKVLFGKNLTPFLKPIKTSSFCFNKKTKKLYSVNITFCTIPEVITNINKILNIDWFNSLNNYSTYNSISKTVFYRKSILERIWSRRITNPEDLIKFYTKYILKLKNISWKSIRLLLNKLPSFSHWYLLNSIDSYVNNPNLFINKLVNTLSLENYQYSTEYTDYLYQIAVLKIKSNIAYWSLNRFLEEHNKLSNKLLELEISDKKDLLIFSSIYNSYLPSNIKCNFINTEKLCFLESKEMNHCIYSNYWNHIYTKNYIAISIKDKERATVGIRYVKDDNNLVFYLDQIRGRNNIQCSEYLRNTMNDWILNNQTVLRAITKNN